jgi:ubiquinone/menaquinone biosynthesis C-methylase UbiE
MRNKNANSQWFQSWANEYDTTLGKVKRHHKLLDLAVRIAEVKKGDRVLDIGCGTGLLSLKFLARADCSITAIDGSSHMLALFADKIDKCKLSGRIECRKESAEAMRFPPASFDIVAATVALHHVQNKAPVLKNIHRMLKPGGRFVLGEIDMETSGKVDDPKRLVKILDYLKEECVLALKEGGVPAFSRMYDNGKKHILNDGEFCIGFDRWSALCKKAGFRKIEIHPVKSFEWFKVLKATKE